MLQKNKLYTISEARYRSVDGKINVLFGDETVMADNLADAVGKFWTRIGLADGTYSKFESGKLELKIERIGAQG